MRAIVIERPGGPEVLSLSEVQVPRPQRDELLVRVHATALNRADLVQRRGLYAAPAGYPPDIPGLEYAGEVEAVGEDVSSWRLGDRVMGIVGGGGHAEFVCVHEREAIPVPDGVSWAEAAAYCNWLSDLDGLPRFYRMDGDRVVGVAQDDAGTGGGTAPAPAAAVGGSTDEMMRNYYDNEWGVAVTDERGLFEALGEAVQVEELEVDTGVAFERLDKFSEFL